MSASAIAPSTLPRTHALSQSSLRSTKSDANTCLQEQTFSLVRLTDMRSYLASTRYTEYLLRNAPASCTSTSTEPPSSDFHMTCVYHIPRISRAPPRCAGAPPQHLDSCIPKNGNRTESNGARHMVRPACQNLRSNRVSDSLHPENIEAVPARDMSALRKHATRIAPHVPADLSRLKNKRHRTYYEPKDYTRGLTANTRRSAHNTLPRPSLERVVYPLLAHPEARAANTRHR